MRAPPIELFFQSSMTAYPQGHSSLGTSKEDSSHNRPRRCVLDGYLCQMQEEPDEPRPRTLTTGIAYSSQVNDRREVVQKEDGRRVNCPVYKSAQHMWLFEQEGVLDEKWD